MHFLVLVHAELQIAVKRCGQYRIPIAHYGALLLLLPCPNFSKKYRKSPSPLCALSKLADIVVNPLKNSILMKRKPPISTRARLKSPNNPPRGRYRTGGLDDAALKVQQTSEAQFHGLLEENPDAIIIVGRTGHINFASHRIETMFGYLPNELFGKPLGVLIPERYRDLHLGHLDRFMSDPKPRMMGVGLELHALRKDGSEFPTEISLSPHRTPDGLVVVAAIPGHRGRQAITASAVAGVASSREEHAGDGDCDYLAELANCTEPGRRPIGRRKPIGCLGQGA